MSRKKKIDDDMIKLAFDLCKSGLNDKNIIEALGISKSGFYANMELIDSIKRAKNELRQEVANALLTKATDERDTTALIFLSKRLNLFSEDFSINLKSPQTALKSLEDVANANISLEHKNSLKGIISDYLKGYEIVELEKRVEQLENEKLNQ